MQTDSLYYMLLIYVAVSFTGFKENVGIFFSYVTPSVLLLFCDDIRVCCVGSKQPEVMFTPITVLNKVKFCFYSVYSRYL
jgi:hypothetical protein